MVHGFRVIEGGRKVGFQPNFATRLWNISGSCTPRFVLLLTATHDSTHKTLTRASTEPSTRYSVYGVTRPPPVDLNVGVKEKNPLLLRSLR